MRVIDYTKSYTSLFFRFSVIDDSTSTIWGVTTDDKGIIKLKRVVILVSMVTRMYGMLSLHVEPV